MTKFFNFEFGKFVYDNGKIYINDKEVNGYLNVEFTVGKDEFPNSN